MDLAMIIDYRTNKLFNLGTFRLDNYLKVYIIKTPDSAVFIIDEMRI